MKKDRNRPLIKKKISSRSSASTVHKRVEEELRTSHEQLRNLTRHLQSVREEERARIAREIHDELGSALTAQKINLTWLKTRLPKDETSLLKKVESMLQLTDMTVDAAQRISSELRPRLLDAVGLEAAIEQHAEEFESRTGTKCAVTVNLEGGVADRDLSITIFRIFQEALTNVARHAGATKVEVRLVQTGGMLTLIVKDNGKGIAKDERTKAKSFGLIGIRERVHCWGGEFDIKGMKGKGTTLEVIVPVGDPTMWRHMASPRLVGRDESVRRLRSLLEKSNQGEGALVLIHGEAGIGKTRLVTEVGQDLETRGGRFLLGGCHEDTHAIPYYPFREAITRFLEVRKEEGFSVFENLPVYSQWELARVVPGLKEMQPPGVDPAKDRLRLFEAFRLLAQSLAKRLEGPLLLTVDDLHLSGDATLDLLHYLARNLAESRVLLCATYRTEEAGESLNRFTNSMRSEKLSDSIPLKPLSFQDVSTVVDLFYPDAEIPHGFRDSLYQKTEGNPFFVEELLKLVPRVEVTEGLTRIEEIPSSVHAALERRVSSLDPRVREVLSCAALLGEEFEFEVLRGALDRPQTEVMEAVEVGSRAHIVHESTRGEEERYRFIHALMAEVLYSVIGKARRRLWHSQVGEVLEKMYPGRLEVLNGQLAHHFERGEKWDKALKYTLISASQAREAYANKEAMRLYEKAREMLARLRAGSESGKDEEITIAEGLGDIHRIAGNYEKAIDEYRLMKESARKIGDSKREGEALSRIGSALEHQGSYDEAMTYMERSQGIFREAGDEKGSAQSLNAIGNIHFHRGEHGEALKCYEVSLNMLREVGDRRAIAASLNNIGNIHFDWGHYEDALRWYEDALKINRETGNKKFAAVNLTNIGIVHMGKGDYGEALKYHEEALAIDKEIGDRMAIAQSLNNIALVHANREDIEAALKCLEESLKIAREIGNRMGVAWCLLDMGDLYQGLCHFEKAMECHKESLALLRKIGAKDEEAIVLVGIGNDFHFSGDDDKALRYLNKALRETEELKIRRIEPWVLAALSEVWLARSRQHSGKSSRSIEYSTRKADEYCERLLKIAGEEGLRAHIAKGRKLKGEILLSRAIAEHKTSSSKQTRSSKSKTAREETGTSLLMEAEAELNEALRIAEGIGSNALQWQIHASLGELRCASNRKSARRKATEEFKKARTIVLSIASGIADEELRKTFLDSKQVRSIPVCRSDSSRSGN